MSNRKNRTISNREYRLESPLDSLDFIIENGELILENLMELQNLYKKYSYPIIKIQENLIAIVSAKQQYIIAMVSGMEHFFKDLLIDLINEELVDLSGLRDKFNLEDIIKLKKGNVNLGELIVKNYNFQNLDEINKIYSKILNVSFYEKIKEVVKTPEYERDISYLRLNDNFYPLIHEVIEIRHKCIHDFNLFYDIDLEKLKKYSHQIQSLALATAWLLDEYLGIRLKDL